MNDRDRSPHRSIWSWIAAQLIILWHQPEATAAGLLYCLCGLAMIVFLFAVATLPANDIFTVISLFIVVEGYTIVATLMITMGLRKLLEPSSRFDQFLDHSWRHLFVWVIGSSLIVAGCWLIAVW